MIKAFSHKKFQFSNKTKRNAVTTPSFLLSINHTRQQKLNVYFRKRFLNSKRLEKIIWKRVDASFFFFIINLHMLYNSSLPLSKAKNNCCNNNVLKNDNFIECWNTQLSLERHVLLKYTVCVVQSLNAWVALVILARAWSKASKTLETLLNNVAELRRSISIFCLILLVLL